MFQELLCCPPMEFQEELEVTHPAQAWQKYLISGIDAYQCQNRKVLILSMKYRFPEPNSLL
jgi:hypothetical protein